MKISLGSDHAGFDLKKEILKYFRDKDYLVSDEGTYSLQRSDYADYAKIVAEKVRDKVVDKGILICGTGIGMSIVANKIHKIRASLCVTEYMAEMSRLHNDANILCLGARLVENNQNILILQKWLETEFEGDRHIKRLKKITLLEQKIQKNFHPKKN
ncbi:MAG: ribose 5-phosphate isomerase B [Elusimicrobiota bacterium]|nr:ribose 5-phosphate isomerase B [Elusimicrobiota bacterium]